MKSVLAWIWRMIFSLVKSVLAWMRRHKFLTVFLLAAFLYWGSFNWLIMPYRPYCDGVDQSASQRTYRYERMGPLYRRNLSSSMTWFNVSHKVDGDRILVSWRLWARQSTDILLFILEEEYRLAGDVFTNLNNKSAMYAIQELREAASDDPEIVRLFAKFDALPWRTDEWFDVQCELLRRVMIWGLEDEIGGG